MTSDEKQSTQKCKKEHIKGRLLACRVRLEDNKNCERDQEKQDQRYEIYY